MAVLCKVHDAALCPLITEVMYIQLTSVCPVQLSSEYNVTAGPYPSNTVNCSGWPCENA